jgi:hypothetical protein
MSGCNHEKCIRDGCKNCCYCGSDLSDGNIYCYLCDKKIGVYPDEFSVCYTEKEPDDPKALHKKCLAKVIVISKANFATS